MRLRSLTGLTMVTALALAAAMPSASTAQTLATSTVQTTGTAINYIGQSFTVSGTAAQYSNINFSFLAGPANSATGTLYLYSSAQAVSPAGLATDTTDLVGSAAAANNVFSFSPTVVLTTGTQYFAYGDSKNNHGSASGNPYTGGVLFSTAGGSMTANYGAANSSLDGSFVVTGTAVSAAPEPGTWLMMIIGFGVVGTSLRRRKRVGGSGSFAALAA